MNVQASESIDKEEMRSEKGGTPLLGKHFNCNLDGGAGRKLFKCISIGKHIYLSVSTPENRDGSQMSKAFLA